MAKLTGKKKAAFLRRMARGRAKAHPNRAKAKHRPRTKPNAARKSAPRKKKSTRHAKAKTHRNPGEILTLLAGNPAKRRHKVAAAKSRKKKASHKGNPGRRPKKVMHHRKRSHRGNPAGASMSDIFMLGAGGFLGAAGASGGAQLLGSSNTGWVGYAANLFSTGLLAWLIHAFTKNKLLAAGVWAGGVGATIRRIIGDYSLLGSMGTSLGVGDYMVSNWVSPQRLPDALHSAMVQIPQGWGGGGAAIVGSGQAANASMMGMDDSRGMIS